MMKIIFHVDELTKWQLCLGNVTNMSNYYQVQNIDYQIEVLANSEAVIAYQLDYDHEIAKFLPHYQKKQRNFYSM